jgi:hypothetical protein
VCCYFFVMFSCCHLRNASLFHLSVPSCHYSYNPILNCT